MPAYIGVNGKAKAIAKVYKGDSNGKAQLIWGPKGIVKYTGNIKDLSVARHHLSATTVGNYALFGGGSSATNTNEHVTYYSTVDAYNTSLTRTTATDLSEKKFYLSATTVGNYALFGGGCIGTYSSTSTVDAYDSFLTRTTATSLNGVRDELGATTVGNYALFGGGLYRGHYDVRTVEVYDSSLTRTTATDLSHSRSSPEATTVGNYALFGGGRWSDTLSTVDAYYIWE